MQVRATAESGGDRTDIVPLGDSALLFFRRDGETGDVREFAEAAARIRRSDWPGVKESVPAYRSLAVHFDPEKLAPGGKAEAVWASVRELAGRVLRLLDECSGTAKALKSRHVRLPVRFGGSAGPDLAACARRSGLTEDEFVRLFVSAEYEVAMLGFAPGFPYLSGLPAALAQPRHDSPRRSVAAGSVGIGGTQTGIYPVESPGGWQLIGRCAVPLFRPDEEEPFLLSPGDRVTFVSVPSDTPDATDRKESFGNDEPESTGRKSCVRAFDAGSESAFEVLKPGMQTTVQDGGRTGWQAYGVPAGGAMDPVSMRTANLLVGNPEDAAVLEMTMLGGTFKLERNIVAAICGADMEARADGVPLPTDRPLLLGAGTILSFGRAARGCRTYLAIAGGIDVPEVLGSRSADVRSGIGGTNGRALRTGDRIRVGKPSAAAVRLSASLQALSVRNGGSWATALWSAGNVSGSRRQAAGPVSLRIIPGAEWEFFGEETKDRLLTETFRVHASSNRMGLRLSGVLLSGTHSVELVSHGVTPGTVQVPPDGNPIVLGADCQPTGGYPKIAHVVGADLPLLAQCAPGDEIRFRLSDLEEAWNALAARERDLRILRTGIRMALNMQLETAGVRQWAKGNTSST